MQTLLVFQSLWSMQGLRSAGAPRSLDEHIHWIVQQKFDGVSCAWLGRDTARPIWRAAHGTHLRIEGICLPQSVDDLKRTFELTAEFPINHLVVQANVRPMTIDASAPLLEEWLRLIEQVHFPVYFETHRDRLTSDLFFTLELLQRYPQIRLLADLSHYVVARGFAYPVSQESDRSICEILDRAWAYHGRVASNHQVQLEIAFPANRKWADQFCSWWTYGFRSWQRRATPDESLVFTCELGPQPYAVAGSDGLDLTDRLADALQLRDMARRSWQSACSQARGPADVAIHETDRSA